jgi:hypothetical protein
MKLFAALREDTQQGWVWLENSSLTMRSIVKIKNTENDKSVYCEALQIDKNFLKTYNQEPRHAITDTKNTLVISGWYRAKLGDLKTQSDASLVITACNSWWGKFRACTHHPQVIVRVAAWLGLVSVILGLLGVIISLVSLLPSLTHHSSGTHNGAPKFKR